MLNSGSPTAAFSNAAWTEGNVFNPSNGWTQDVAGGSCGSGIGVPPRARPTRSEPLGLVDTPTSAHVRSSCVVEFSGRRPRVRNPGGILTHHRRCHACGRFAWDLLHIPNGVMPPWDKPESHATVAGDPRDRNPRGILTHRRSRTSTTRRRRLWFPSHTPCLQPQEHHAP